MCEIVAFTGGKGSPGKTCLALNTAVTLGGIGATVLLLDMNDSAANIGTALGLRPLYNLNDLVWGYCSAEEVIVPWGENVGLVSLGEPIGWNGEDKMSRFLSLAPLLNRRNFVLIDTPAEDGESLGPLIEGAEHVLAVVTPEQVANAEALAFIMNLHRIAGGKHIYVILNRAPSSEISDLICNRLEHDIGKILGIPMTCLGYVPEEPLMASAAEALWPFVVVAPESETSSCLAHVAGAISEICGTQRQDEGSERFLRDLFGSLQNDKPLSLAIEGQRGVRDGISEASQEEVELFRRIILEALDPNKADSLDFVTMYQHVREVVETSKSTKPVVAGFPSPTA
ncbi:MAG: MinD/ParA family protein [Desulfomonilaceae bacterium]